MEIITSFESSIEFAKALDSKDPLRHLRDEFLIPQKDGNDVIYLCGNSLGLQPRSVKAALEVELMDWQNL
ncbi:MAG: kynureninase, partial [Bacteroidetes bacterium]|nr:kynureninase [Bacteroidota bacterium]